MALAALLHMEPSQHDCAGVSGRLFLVSLFVPTAGFIAPKMHSRAFDTQVGIHFVPGNSQEFLSSFPSASFSWALSLWKPPLSMEPALPWACGGQETRHGPWLYGTACMTWAFLLVGLAGGLDC